MKVYVTIQLFKGIVEDIDIWTVEGIAKEVENIWLHKQRITTRHERSIAANNGTSFIVKEFDL